MSKLKHAVAFAPSVLIVLLLVSALIGIPPEPMFLVFLVGLQVVWAGLWFGGPWVARKAGAAIGS